MAFSVSFKSIAYCPQCGRRLVAACASTCDGVVCCEPCLRSRTDELHASIDLLRRRIKRCYVSVEHGLLLWCPETMFFRSVEEAYKGGHVDSYPEALGCIF
jgi:hypothetical protein